MTKRKKTPTRTSIAKLSGQLQGQLAGQTGTTAAATAAPAPAVDPATAAANLKYGAEEREMLRQLRASRQQDQRIGDWYSQLQAQRQAQAANTQQIYQNAQSDVSRFTQGASPFDGQLQAPEAAQAAASRRSLAGSYVAALAGQGAAAANYANDLVGVAADQGLQAHEKEAALRRSTRDDLVALKGEKGDYKVQYNADQANTKFQNALLAHEFGLKNQTEQDTVAGDRADRRLKARTEKLHALLEQQHDAGTVNRWGFTNAEWTAMSPARRQRIIAKQKTSSSGSNSSGKDQFGNTEVQQRDRTNDWHSGLQFFKDHPTLLGNDAALSIVQDEAGIPYDIAKAVLFASKNDGKLSRSLYKKLRRLGVSVPRRRIAKPIKPTSKPATGKVPVGTGISGQVDAG